MGTKRLLRTGILGVSLVTTLVVSGSASYAQNFTLFDVNGGPGTPTVQCSAPTAIVNGTSGLQFVVEGSIDGTTGARVGLASHVDCVIKTNFGSFGGASGDGVGPEAVAAGTSQPIVFEKLAGVRVCGYGSVFYQGGVQVYAPVSPGC